MCALFIKNKCGPPSGTFIPVRPTYQAEFEAPDITLAFVIILILYICVFLTLSLKASSR